MNNPKHRMPDDSRGDRLSAVATCFFLATALGGIGFDVAGTHTKPVGNSTPDTEFPDNLVGYVVPPTLRKAVSAALPWHHDVDGGLMHPKRAVVASPTPIPAPRSKPTESPFVASSTPTTPTTPPARRRPHGPLPTLSPPPPGPGHHRKGDPGCDRLSDLSDLVRCLLTGDQPRTERHDWSRLDAAPSTMRAWQIHTRDADSGPTRSPSSASAALFAK